MNYDVIAFYCITKIDDPHKLIEDHRKFFENLDVMCRIYISEEGINSQMSASPMASIVYQEWLKQYPMFKNIEFKIHKWHEHCFPRQQIKYRKQLVALDAPVDFGYRANHCSSEEWKQMLENKDENTIVIDVRNRYESKVGYFEGSELPQVDTTREFVKYTQDLKEKIDPKNTKVYMCCTGGIRCELYSAYMAKEGFDNIKQLDGGIIKYGLEQGNKHWKGKLFVFDDRMVVPISDDPCEMVGTCHFCGCASDAYYNCANIDCNELFLSCPECIEIKKGACCPSCESAPRLRPFDKKNGSKPFKKAHHYRSCAV
jgi:UPF0176 protein